MKVVVIGGGPAGMMCAGKAAEQGANVILIDKNEKLGKKLFITGKGRCNVTNDSSCENHLSNVVRNPKFLMSAYHNFSPQDTMEFYPKFGTPLVVERGGRVFPKSDKSSDIIKAHIKYLDQNNVEILLNSRVNQIIIKDSSISGVRFDDGSIIDCDAVVIATGGLSYPVTGCTGDGYSLAKMLGHTIIETKSALVPLFLEETHELQGLSLKNVEANILNSNNKKLLSEFGEMIFTDNGVSGPIILTISSKINRIKEKLILSIDLKPALSYQQLDERIIRDFKENINKDFINSLDNLLPKSLIPEIIVRSDIDPRLKVNEINKESRRKLVNTLKSFKFTIKGLDSIDKGIITSGGINVKEINPKDMQSKIINGLYFAGEIMDVDALTGGYNIQIALSTGYLVGNSFYN